MKDTPPDIEERYRVMLMARTGEERLIMGCAMRDTARAKRRTPPKPPSERSIPSLLWARVRC
jgi:hypothetical protein